MTQTSKNERRAQGLHEGWTGRGFMCGSRAGQELQGLGEAFGDSDVAAPP